MTAAAHESATQPSASYTYPTRLLEIDNLSVAFPTRSGPIFGVKGVTMNVGARERIGVVGESGSGKSVTALSIMRLIPTPPGRIVSGKLLFGGQDLLSVGKSRLRQLRGNEISMIFQDPMTSLNPVFTIGHQVEETLRAHTKLNRAQIRARAIELLERVGIPTPERKLRDYPHNF
jgi:oligopeptide transport system ATP-binding protein